MMKHLSTTAAGTAVEPVAL